jgi:hypothetical protein|tara:strand:- start:27 stop:407 length:381 start_codon:yes stop_codon:yes gene_type:complete
MKPYKYYKSKQQYKEYNFELDKKIKLIDNLNSIYNTKYTLRFFPATLSAGFTFYHDGMPFSLSNHDDEILTIDDFEKADLYIKTLSKIEDFIVKNKAKLFDSNMDCNNVHLSKNMKMIQKMVEENI